MNQSAESVSLFFDNRRCYSKPMTSDSVFRVDWPMVLGNMYYKYDKFKLVINNYTCLCYTARTANYSQHMVLKMTGLNFINSCSGGSYMNESTTKDVITGISSNEATLAVVDTGNPAVGTNNVSANNIFGSDGDSVTFDRPPNSPVDITFILRDYRNNNCPASFIGPINGLIFTVGVTIYGLYD